MPDRILLLTTPNSYRDRAFLAAAERLGVEVITASDMPRQLARCADDDWTVSATCRTLPSFDRLLASRRGSHSQDWRSVTVEPCMFLTP